MELAQQALNWHVAAGDAAPQCSTLRSGGVSSQTIRTDEAEDTLHQRSARPRSPQQQVEHVHLLMTDCSASRAATAAGVFAAGQSWTSWSRPDAPSTTSWGASVRRAIRDGRQRRPPASRTRCVGSVRVANTEIHIVFSEVLASEKFFCILEGDIKHGLACILSLYLILSYLRPLGE